MYAFAAIFVILLLINDIDVTITTKSKTLNKLIYGICYSIDKI
jgi:hypothetical protein